MSSVAAGQAPGSMETIPAMPSREATAAWKGYMPDCEWLISTTRPRRRAMRFSAVTLGLGVPTEKFQSGTICFQNSPWAARGKRMPG